MINQIELFELDNNTWNHLTAYNQMSFNSYKSSYPQTIRLQIKGQFFKSKVWREEFYFFFDTKFK